MKKTILLYACILFSLIGQAQPSTQPVNSNMDVSGGKVKTNVNVPADAPVIRENSNATVPTSSSNMTIESQLPDPSATCKGLPMTPGDFETAKTVIRQASFEDSKLSSAREIAGSNCLYANQIAEICAIFDFEKTKLAFAKVAYRHCIDPQNYSKVSKAFTTDASKKDLNKYIGH
jgi:hypothetical protein